MCQKQDNIVIKKVSSKAAFTGSVTLDISLHSSIFHKSVISNGLLGELDVLVATKILD